METTAVDMTPFWGAVLLAFGFSTGAFAVSARSPILKGFSCEEASFARGFLLGLSVALLFLLSDGGVFFCFPFGLILGILAEITGARRFVRDTVSYFTEPEWMRERQARGMRETRNETGLTLLELIVVLLVIGIVAGVIYSKAINTRVAKRSAAVLEMLRLKKAVFQLVESRGVTDLSDTDFQNDLSSLVSGKVSPLGGTYSVSVDSANDRITLSEDLSSISAGERTAFAQALAKRICPECSTTSDPVACCSAVSVSESSVNLEITLDQ